MVNAHPPTSAGSSVRGRFNVLLTEDRTREDEHWTRQLPRLMEPMGMHAHVASTGREALEAAQRTLFHAAVVDLATPVGRPRAGGDPDASDAGGSGEAAGTGGDRGAGGLWLLQLLQRHDRRPPIVVVNSHVTHRDAVRLLNEALRLGAFSVINRPVSIDSLLGVIARLMQRNYNNTWPDPPSN